MQMSENASPAPDFTPRNQWYCAQTQRQASQCALIWRTLSSRLSAPANVSGRPPIPPSENQQADQSRSMSITYFHAMAKFHLFDFQAALVRHLH